MCPARHKNTVLKLRLGVVGQIHQHLFCARLDLTIDGDQNSVIECNTLAEPAGPENPYGNAFYIEQTTLAKACGRARNTDTERYWKFINPNQQNAVGHNTAYTSSNRRT